MGPKTAVSEGDLFRHPLREQINLKHPLVRLADLINWDGLNASMSASFVSRKGRPATSPRLIAGLLYLQHAFDLSDEEVVCCTARIEAAAELQSRGAAPGASDWPLRPCEAVQAHEEGAAHVALARWAGDA